MPIDLVFSCVCPVIDHEFRHNIVKVASRGSADYSYCKKFNCSHPFEALHFKLLVMKYYQVLKNFPFNFHAFSLISISLEPYTSPTNFYKELPNADFPKLHDYDCLNSRLFGACQLAVYDVTEAKYKCDMDDQCKAFVTTAETLWTGEWRESL